MKKLKTILVVATLIISIVLLVGKVDSYPNSPRVSISTFAQNNRWKGDSGAYYWTITSGTIENSSNIYCVEQGDIVPSGNKYYCDNTYHGVLDYGCSCGNAWLYNIWYCSAKAVITNTTTTFYSIDKYSDVLSSSGLTSKGSRSKTDLDNVVAAILSEGDGMWSSRINIYTISKCFISYLGYMGSTRMLWLRFCGWRF